MAIWGLRSPRTLVITCASLAGIVLCVLPPAYMFWQAIGVLAFDGIALDARQRGLLLTTTWLGVLTSAGASVVGVPLGIALARIRLPFKTALRLLLATPVVVPLHVLALAWTYLLLSGTYTFGGAVLVLTVGLYPLSMLATEAALRRVDGRLEEAALLSATTWRVIVRISVPLAARWILAAALIVFVLAISDFSVPAVLRVRVFTTEVFTAFAARYDFAGATAVAVPLLAVSTAAAAAAAALLRGRPVTTTRASRAGTFDVRARTRAIALGAMVVLAGLTALLPALLLWVEASRADSLVAVIRGSGEAAVNSVLLAAAGATVLTFLGGCLGYARARSSEGRGVALDMLAVILFAVPATVTGIGLIGVWNRSATDAIYGTATMLVLGSVARFLPIGALAAAASVRSVSIAQEEAAAVAGASWWRTMTAIVLPQVATGLIATWVIVFVLAFGEVGTSILVAPPGETTLPIRVYTLIANAPPGHVATLALTQAVVALSPLVLLALALAGREGV